MALRTEECLCQNIKECGAFVRCDVDSRQTDKNKGAIKMTETMSVHILTYHWLLVLSWEWSYSFLVSTGEVYHSVLLCYLCMHACCGIKGRQRTTFRVVLSLCHVGPWNETQVVGFGCKCLFWLSNLAPLHTLTQFFNSFPESLYVSPHFEKEKIENV